jgi:hypothetical protein
MKIFYWSNGFWCDIYDLQEYVVKFEEPFKELYSPQLLSATDITHLVEKEIKNERNT